MTSGEPLLAHARKHFILIAKYSFIVPGFMFS
jgi:hypothetical protein